MLFVLLVDYKRLLWEATKFQEINIMRKIALNFHNSHIKYLKSLSFFQQHNSSLLISSLFFHHLWTVFKEWKKTKKNHNHKSSRVMPSWILTLVFRYSIFLMFMLILFALISYVVYHYYFCVYFEDSRRKNGMTK